MTSGMPSCTMLTSVPTSHLLECHRHLDFAGQIGIVEPVRVAQALRGHEFQIFAAEGMAEPGGEVAE